MEYGKDGIDMEKKHNGDKKHSNIKEMVIRMVNLVESEVVLERVWKILAREYSHQA